MTTRALLCVILVQLSFAAPAAARQTTQALTLEEAKRIAAAQNPAARRALASRDLAEVRERQAYNGVFRPQFGSGLNFSIGRFRRYTAEDFTGQPLENPYYAQATSSSTSQSIGMSMELFSGSRWLELSGARAGVRQSQAALSTELHQVGAEVERRFYRVLLADDAVALEERLAATARERREVQKHRVAAGMALPVDLLGAEIEVLDHESRLEESRGEALKARLQLLDALGMTRDVELELAGTVPEAFDPSHIGADAVVARALRSSPRVQQAEMELENSHLQRRRARAFRWPTVRGNAAYTRNRATAGSDAFFELFPKNWGYDVSLQVSLPVPILRFNENLGIAAAEISHTRVAEDDATTRATLERQVRAAVIDLNNSYRSLESARRRAELSTERARLAMEGNRHGTVSFIEFQQYNDQEAQAHRALLNARVAFTTVLLALEELLGEHLER
jgi:outer membrane protein